MAVWPNGEPQSVRDWADEWTRKNGDGRKGE